MSGWVLAALLAGLAGALLVPPRVSVRDEAGGRACGGISGVGAGAGWADGLGEPGAIGWRGPAARAGWMVRWRWLLAALAGAGAASFVGGRAGLFAAPVAVVAAWVALGRVEPAAVRRDREQARRELPHVVRLLGTALAAGAAPVDALEVVAEALPGAATRRLLPVAVQLRLGADPVATWAVLAGDPALAPLGRALARAQSGGVPVATAVARLADDLTRAARADVEDRARAVGVRAAAPLGLCLLPAFLLIGIVPLVGGLLSSLAL
jgi:Flp pilus assembly protein TadB